MFGKAPSDYFKMDDGYFWLGIDIACAVGHWEDENHHYEESTNKSNRQAGDIGQVLEKYRQQLNERG